MWDWVTCLLGGASVAPGKRTVTAALRGRGVQGEWPVQHGHRVLTRATWSRRTVRRMGLRLLRHAFVPLDAPVVVGVAAPIERRRGATLAAQGIYRAAGRSSTSFVGKTSGVRWGAMRLLASIPWTQRVWALPCVTVLAPAERYHQERGLRHRQLTD